MAQNSFVRTEEGTTFANPNDPNEVAWRLKYSIPTKSDLMVAASYMECYAYLFTIPQKLVLKKMSMVKKAMAEDGK
jgi:hypothetical protein